MKRRSKDDLRCSMCGGPKTAVTAKNCFQCNVKRQKKDEDVIEMYVYGYNVQKIAKHLVTSETYVRKVLNKNIKQKLDYMLGIYVGPPKYESPFDVIEREKKKIKEQFVEFGERHLQYKKDLESEMMNLKEDLESIEEQLFECDAFLGLLETPQNILRKKRIEKNAKKLMKAIFGTNAYS